MKDLIAELRNHPVAVAVEPIRQDAMKSAEQWARRFIDRALAELEAAGWDLNKAAPNPRGTMGRVEYHTAAIKRQMYSAITTWTKPSIRYGEPCIVKPDAANEAKFIDQAKQDASYAYDAFIAKLCAKVGECHSAKLDGSHVWGYSVLTVTKIQTSTDGVRCAGFEERWKTQQITNVSKLGKYFPQWPTRLMK